MTNRVLNICLHNIVNDASELKTIYDLTISQLTKLEMILEEFRNKGLFTSYVLFFDDGYKSFINLARSHDFKIDRKFIHAAVITERLNSDNHLTSEDVCWLHDAGFSIDSHSVSHAALAIFKEEKLQNTPTDKTYRNMPYGKSELLGSEEVRYQLIESINYLQVILGKRPDAFVLPYGLYNEQTVFIASTSTSYNRLYTCDKAYDIGQFLSPRFLVTQDNIKTIADEIMNLTDEYTPLPLQA